MEEHTPKNSDFSHWKRRRFYPTFLPYKGDLNHAQKSEVCRFHQNLGRYLAVALLLAYFIQGMVHIRHASITFDEGPHLAVGYTTLRTGDLRLQPVHIHPPLANLLAAAPLLLQHDLPHPASISGWEIASLSAITDTVVWQYPHPARIATVGRLPILWLGVLLGALIFRWAAGRRRRIAGLIALTLYAFDPNFIAHGSLITTDMAAVFFMTATLYITANTSKDRRRWIRSVILGTLLGLAQLAKVSALMLVPVVGLALWLQDIAYRPLKITRESGWPRLVSYVCPSLQCVFHIVLILTTAAFVIWAGYGFQWTEVPINAGPLLQTERLKSLLRTTSIKIPAGTHFLIYQSLREHYALGHPTFLMGRVSTHGWWWYFPVAFILKTPLPTLILTLWAAACTLSGKRRHALSSKQTQPNAQDITPLSLFSLLYALSSLFSTVNIGYRHLLPLLPFLYISIGRALTPTLGLGQERLGQETFAQRMCGWVRSLTDTLQYGDIPFLVAALLLLWHMTGTFRIAPHYLTFFNEIAGGATGGYRYLVDSNLDWGQNLWDLKRWLTRVGEETTTEVVTTNATTAEVITTDAITTEVVTTNRTMTEAITTSGHVYYAHYSPARPSSYGINADFLPPDPRAVTLTPWQPAPGLYAIGATVLQGPYAPDINTYAWFRAHEPTTRLGNALWVYDVPPRPQVTWAVVCMNAGLSPETLKTNMGEPNLRIIHTDCTQTHVYPEDPGHGLYVVRGIGQRPHPTSSATLSGDGLPTKPPDLEVQLRDKQGNITHNLYRMTDTAPSPTHPITHLITPGPLDFLGYTLYLQPDNTLKPVLLNNVEGSLQPGDILELHAFWRVTAVPGRPLSLMAHLIGPDGTAVAVGDGLGYPIEQWQPGDLVIQRHTLTVPVQAAPGDYRLLSGAYWLDNLERWTFYDPRARDESPISGEAKRDAISIISLQLKKVNISDNYNF